MCFVMYCYFFWLPLSVFCKELGEEKGVTSYISLLIFLINCSVKLPLSLLWDMILYHNLSWNILIIIISSDNSSTRLKLRLIDVLSIINRANSIPSNTKSTCRRCGYIIENSNIYYLSLNYCGSDFSFLVIFIVIENVIHF